MIKNNIEIDVKVKCIEAETTQAKLAAAIDSTPPYMIGLVIYSESVINLSFVRLLVELGYDFELNFVKRES